MGPLWLCVPGKSYGPLLRLDIDAIYFFCLLSVCVSAVVGTVSVSVYLDVVSV